jgi:5-methylcytosine-specific restriction protein B
MPALQLILDAIDQPTIPHFLILDEMNLSHVERYFADFLSAIESGEAIPLYEGGPRTSSGRSVPQRLELPKNLFVIGTVNVDETTYMFSPKVLDRANVIEFRMVIEDLEAFLQEPIKPDLDSLAGRGAHFAEPFLRASASEAVVPANFKAQFEEELSALFAVLHKHHAEFGFRTAYEASRFLHFYIMLGGEFTEAMDCIIVQKLMPKLHGSRSKLSKLLRDLWHVCLHEPKARETKQASDPSEELLSAALYPLSAEKICRMWALLKENGFASFAEA